MFDRTLINAILGVLAFAIMPAASHGAPAIACPLRDQPYSTRSPLIDLLLKPEAVAVIDRDAPGLLKRISPWLKGTTVPTFSVIVTLHSVARSNEASDDGLAILDRDLARLPITAGDREARCARYDVDNIRLEVPAGRPAILVFEKMTGFLDAPSVEAAHAALAGMARRKGWAMVTTHKGGAMTQANLRRFDAVVLTNVSGDALTVAQRRAFRAYIEHGGGFVGLHGAGGDPAYFWDWYVDTLLGARFIGHPMGPQFQEAQLAIADPDSPIVKSLVPGWRMTDEWYSFGSNPRAGGAHVLVTLDEATYSPRSGQDDLRMGDHPIAWTRCIGTGRSFYSAIGHRPESYSEPHYVRLLENAVDWAAGAGATRCQGGREIAQHR